MSSNILAKRREDETSFPTYQALINTMESAHTYATLSPTLSPDNKARLRQHAASVPRIINDILYIELYHIVVNSLLIAHLNCFPYSLLRSGSIFGNMRY
jgi:hypothetical protein